MENKNKYLIIGGLIGVTLISGIALAFLYKSQDMQWDDSDDEYY